MSELVHTAELSVDDLLAIRGAIEWCGGSSSFAPASDGQEPGEAREGWEKICIPILDGLTSAIAIATDGRPTA